MMDEVKVLFSELRLRNITLPNRIIRSATYEGWGRADGLPRPELADVYRELARGGVGTIITGFAFVSQAGRAMHPGQCGIDADEGIAAWKAIVSAVKAEYPETRLLMQIAHTGRQTLSRVTGLPVLGVSSRPCTYFRQRPHIPNDAGIRSIIGQFADAASRAHEAGFDGIQLHAAHGYLIHQFLSHWTNSRKDVWRDGPLFMEEIIREVRRRCGDGFPIFVKLSWADDNTTGVRIEDTIQIAKRLDALGVDAVEISYGTMEYALNIIRGAVPIDAVLAVNPMFSKIPSVAKSIWKRFCAPAYLRKFIPFEQEYNLSAAAQIKREVGIPVVAVGGFRTLDGMTRAVNERRVDAVALCRPLICEPDIPKQILDGRFSRSSCTNCNLCTIYCDSQQPLRCYGKRETV